MNINNMTLQEKLCRDVERAWQNIVYDATLKISHATDAEYEYENCTVYEAGSQKRIAFYADAYENKAADDVRKAITAIKKKFPACSKYNFTIGEVESGIHRKILLTLE
ncbi:MAG: hypothetical protein J5806_11555 [Lentisphaeria bacterium]|nr:hypothetical protein [Lentisphaeria bacterium]